MSESSLKLPKPRYGQIVVLQKNGDEPRGHGFPIINSSCTIGRDETSDIRVSSADVSLTHCKFHIDETSGEASLEILGNETDINGSIVDPVTTIKLNHRDVILVGGRRFRFEYLPPDYKPLPSKSSVTITDTFKAEVVDREENGDVVDINAEKEEEEIVDVPCTPSTKRVSFGPYLSPEQFDNTLPPATPVKRGATPRRSTRYSGLKFTRSTIDPLIEEELVSETVDETKADETAKSDRLTVDETIMAEEQDAKSVSSSDDISTGENPSLCVPDEISELTTPVNVDTSSMDAMSTMSDVSNVAVVPSECCSFLDEPIEEDFGPEVVEQEETVSQLETSDLLGANEDIEDDQIPNVSTTTPLVNGRASISNIIPSTTQPSEDVEDEEEGITLSPEDMSAERFERSINHPAVIVEPVENTGDPEHLTGSLKSPLKSLRVDSNDVQGVRKLISATPAADKTNVEDVKQPPQTPKAADTTPETSATGEVNVAGMKKLIDAPTPSSEIAELGTPPEEDQNSSRVIVNVQTSPDSNVEVDSMEELSKIPIQGDGESKSVHTNGHDDHSQVAQSPEKSPVPNTAAQKPAETSVKPATKGDFSEVEGIKDLLKTPKSTAQTTKGDYSYVEGVKKLLETPQPARDSPKADYSNVEGMKRLLQTPKTQVSTATGTPQADYTDVRGVKKLLQTPKAPPSTPKADYSDVRGVKRLMKTPSAPPNTPKADYSNVEGIDRLMKTPKPADEEVENGDHIIEQDAVEAETKTEPVRKPSVSPDSGCQTPSQDVNLDGSDSKESSVEPTIETPPSTKDEPVVEVKEEPPATAHIKPVEVAKAVETPRRGRKATVATPKTLSKKIAQASSSSDTDSIEIIEEVRAIPSVQTKPETTVGLTPRRGRKSTAATPKAYTPKPRSKRGPSPPPSESEPEVIEEIREGDSTDTIDLDPPQKTEPVEKAVEKAKEPTVEVASAPQRGRRGATPKVYTPKPRSKQDVTTPAAVKDAPEVIDQKKDEEVVEETRTDADPASVAPPPKVEEPVKVPEEPVVEVASTPQRGRRVGSATPKVYTPKPRSTKAPVDSEPEVIEEEKVEATEVGRVENDVPVVADPESLPTVEENQVVEVSSTPQRCLRTATATPKTQARPTKDSEPAVDVEPVQEEVTIDAEDAPSAVDSETPAKSKGPIETPQEPVDEMTSPPQRGRRATPKAATPRPRSAKAPSTPAPLEIQLETVEEEEKVNAEQAASPTITSDPKSPPEIKKVPPAVDPESPAKIEEPVETPKESVEMPKESVEMPKEPVETPKEPVVQVASTPQRGRRAAAATPKVNTPKPRSKKAQPVSESESETVEQEINVPAPVVEEDAAPVVANPPSPPKSEDVVQPPVVEAEVPSTPRRGRTRAAPTPQVETQKSTVKRKASDAAEAASGEIGSADKEEPAATEPQEAGEDAKVAEVSATPKRGRRGAAAAAAKPKAETPRPRSKRAKVRSDSESMSECGETADKKESQPAADDQVIESTKAPIVEEKVEEAVSNDAEDKQETVNPPGTPRRTRRGAVAPPAKVETPKSRPKRTKQASESESSVHPDEVESATKAVRSSRSKKKKEDVDEAAVLSSVPVVRLTRCEIESPVAEAAPAKVTKKRGAAAAATATKEVAEEKPAAPVRRGRGARTTKTTAAESDEASSMEEKAEEKVEEVPATRRAAPRRANKGVPVIADSSDDTDGDAKPRKTTTTTRRAAAKRGVAASAVEKLDTVPEEKKRRVAKPAGLDDVEMMHEGKGHAADIHANHVPDDGEDEKADGSPVATSGRSTRSKRGLKVHFETAGAEASTTPVKASRSTRKTPVIISPEERRVSVRLERDPEIENLASASAPVNHSKEDDEEETVGKAVKRPRAKRTAAATTATTAAAVIESPAKPAKRPRGKKAAADSEAEEAAAPAPPSPRRTRRTRI